MAIPVNSIPQPLGDRLVSVKRRQYLERKQDDPLEGRIAESWSQYFDQQATAVAASPTRINLTPLSGQSVSIGATDMSGGAIAAGLYEVRAYARITTPATTGAATSSLTVTIGWTEGGVVQSEAWAALTGNTVTTVLTGPAKFIRVDSSSPITYATTYASNTAGQMRYELSLVLSRVAA